MVQIESNVRSYDAYDHTQHQDKDSQLKKDHTSYAATALARIQSALESSGRACIDTLTPPDHKLKRDKYEHSLAACQCILERYRAIVSPKSVCHQLFALLTSDTPVRERYRLFLDTLRRILDSGRYSTLMEKWKRDPNANLPELRLIHDLVQARFAQNTMYDRCEELVAASMSPRPGEVLHELPWEEQFKRLDTLPAELNANRLAVNIAKLQGALNVNFDPHRDTNVPYVNYKVTVAGKERTNLRFGTPTLEGYWERAVVVPEFKAYLDAKSVAGERHLYINLQDRNFKPVSNEKDRCVALEALAVEYPNTFSIATLAHDSEFNHQAGRHGHVNDATAFKKEFMHQMLERTDSGFFFSANLRIHEHASKLSETLEIVHDTVFRDRQELTLEERQAFIEIAYALIALQLVAITEADTFNISCKDAIDRAGKFNNLEYYMAGLLSNQTHRPGFKRELMTITHSPALIVKKQPIIPKRRKRLLLALQQLEGTEQAFKALNSRYHVSQIRVCT